VVYGQNVLEWNVTNSMDGRYSDYAATLLAIDTFGALGPLSAFYKATDPNVPRHRLQYLVVEAVANGPTLCERRANWEAARRAGRGTVVTTRVDSWRDAGGTLWTPNTLVPVTGPGLRLQNNQLVLSEVTYRYSEETGKVADLTLMPPAAFALEPIVLQPSALAAALSPQ
jgi:prophage tail gpP-like protein